MKNLKLNPDNPRTIKEKDFEALKEKIKNFPEMLIKRPIVYDETDTIIGGNQRYRALQDLELEGFEVKDEYFSQATDWTEEQKRKFVVLDNLSDGDWNYDELANKWSDLPLGEWGIDTGGWETDEVVEDEAPELQEEAISKLGDVYQLGRHRLMCGDSTKIEDVEKLMNGQKADITFHSPPYNVGHNLGYENDNKYETYKDDNPAYTELLTTTTTNALNVSEYVFVNLQFLANNKRQLIDYLYFFRDFFVDIAYWKKLQVAPAMAKNVMNSQVECIFIFNRENHSRAINTGNFHGDVSNIIETNSASGENENADRHNATFPIKFCSHFIEHFTKDSGSVLDLFGGSGSTLIACEQLNRTCYCQEIDPRYIDVIIARWEKFTGNKAEKVL